MELNADFILGRMNLVGFLINSGIKTAALFLLAAALSLSLHSSAARTRREVWHRTFGVAAISVIVSVFFEGTPLMSLPLDAGGFGITIYRASESSLPLVVWLIGVIAGLSWVVPSLVHRRTIGRSSGPASAAVSRVTALQARRLGIGKTVSVLVGSGVESPATWGVLRPVIFLPHWAAELGVEERSQILIHELEHIRSHDETHRLLARVVCAFLWFNPLCWIALRQMIREQELAADEAVLAMGEPAVRYAETLISSLRLARAAARPILAIPFVGTSQFGARIRSLLRPGASSRRPIVGRATLFAAVAASGIALGSVRLVLQVESLAAPFRPHERSAALEALIELRGQRQDAVFEPANSRK